MIGLYLIYGSCYLFLAIFLIAMLAAIYFELSDENPAYQVVIAYAGGVWLCLILLGTVLYQQFPPSVVAEACK